MRPNLSFDEACISSRLQNSEASLVQIHNIDFASNTRGKKLMVSEMTHSLMELSGHETK
jgi:hypothetical protein